MITTAFALLALAGICFMIRLFRGETVVGGLVVIDLLLFGLETLPVIAFYSVAVLSSGAPRRWLRLIQLPVALSIALGLSLSQSRAVFSGLLGETGVFVRTPKGGSSGYRVPLHFLLLAEVGMAAYLLGALATIIAAGDLMPTPFLGLFALGFSLVGGQSVIELIRASRPAPEGPTVDRTVVEPRGRPAREST